MKKKTRPPYNGLITAQLYLHTTIALICLQEMGKSNLREGVYCNVNLSPHLPNLTSHFVQFTMHRHKSCAAKSGSLTYHHLISCLQLVAASSSSVHLETPSWCLSFFPVFCLSFTKDARKCLHQSEEGILCGKQYERILHRKRKSTCDAQEYIPCSPVGLLSLTVEL